MGTRPQFLQNNMNSGTHVNRTGIRNIGQENCNLSSRRGEQMNEKKDKITPELPIIMSLHLNWENLQFMSWDLDRSHGKHNRKILQYHF